MNPLLENKLHLLENATDYSEGNYRLYDKEALQVLEKIVALKQLGFSLEEIRCRRQ